MKNYYKILNVKPTASVGEIRRNYRALLKILGTGDNLDDPLQNERMADINEAYDTLTDIKTRAEYDAKLQASLANRLKTVEIPPVQQRVQQQPQAQEQPRNSVRSGPIDRSGKPMAFPPTMEKLPLQLQVQAASEITEVRNQAYQSGRERGASEARAEYDKATNKLNADIKALIADNKLLKKQMSDLEQQLFHRDRELAQEKLRAQEIERQLQSLRQVADSKPGTKRVTVELDSLHELVDKAQQRALQLEQEKAQLAMQSQAQLQVQQEKRRQLQEQIDELTHRIAELTVEVVELRSENGRWQQYAKSEQYLSGAEQRLREWAEKQKADRRLAKPTYYGTLGVLIWATDYEINSAFVTLIKKNSLRFDENHLAKLAKINEAYAVLSDPVKRREYNAAIGVTDERIETERRLIKESESIKEEYRSKLADKEFWARFDELNSAALAGDAAAQNELGELYYGGNRVEKDAFQAVFWFKEAAKQKHADAMYNLGVCFINGEGTEQNKNAGLGFIRQAAQLGSSLAETFLRK